LPNWSAQGFVGNSWWRSTADPGWRNRAIPLSRHSLPSWARCAMKAEWS